MKRVLELSLFSCLLSCTSRDKPQASFHTESKEFVDTLRHAPTNSHAQEQAQKIDCDSGLLIVVKNSGIDQEFLLGNKIAVDERKGDDYFIKVYSINELGAEVPVRWLLLKCRQQKIYDITDDPEDPVILKFDSLAATHLCLCK